MTAELSPLDATALDKLVTAAPVENRQRQTQTRTTRRTGPSRNGRRIALLAVAGLALSGIGYGGYRWWLHAQAWVDTDNAYVSADIHEVSPRIAGTIEEVLVNDNQTVAAGAVLARLDSRDQDVRLQQARAQVAQAGAQIQQSAAQVAQAKAQVAKEEAQVNRARLDLQRVKTVRKNLAGAISDQDLDNAQAAYDAAAASLAAAQSTVTAAEAQATAVAAMLDVAQASLADAKLQLSYTEIKAPTAGRVGRKSIESGNHVQPGQALLALVETEVWVTANFKETQLTHVQNGQPVELTIDTFPGKVFSGRVESLAPASGAQFALLPPDNATGNFTKIVQRVPVKVVLDRDSLGAYAGRIVPGMSAHVDIHVRG